MKQGHDSFEYEDIVDLPHHVSLNRKRMSAHDRAAQFSPFAALTGHDAAIKETARRTDRRIELDENQKAMLDEKLWQIRANLEKHPKVVITYFKEDLLKEGGAYEDISVTVRGIDISRRVFLTKEGFYISIDDIYAIEFSDEGGCSICSENY